MATFLGVQALMFRRMMNTYQKTEVDTKVTELKESIDKRFATAQYDTEPTQRPS